jgi:hypothetical protein
MADPRSGRSHNGLRVGGEIGLEACGVILGLDLGWRDPCEGIHVVHPIVVAES